MLSVQMILPPVLVLAVVAAAWFFLRKKEPLPAGPASAALSPLDAAVVILCFAGIFLFPMHIRQPLLYSRIRNLAYINMPCALAVVLSLFRLRRWSPAGLVCFAVWLLLVLPLAVSNRECKPERTASVVVQSLLPLFLLLYRMEPASRRKATGLFLLLFDVFIAVLLVCGIVERFTGKAILGWIIGQLQAAGLDAKEYIRYYQDSRFGFLWGHTLTAALLFNSAFVINVLWLRSAGKKDYTPLFFLPCMLGVLLASSKTGIVVCFLLLVVFSWKHKKWLLALLPVLVVLWLLGVFDRIVDRFARGELTTGRLPALERYFSSGINPIMFFSGYGDRSILNSASPVYALRAGFEFPLLMFAYYFGILFSFFHIVGSYAWSSGHLIREKRWADWLAYSLLFAEMNTYNAYALRNQDVCFFLCFLTMIILNLPAAPAGALPAASGSKGPRFRFLKGGSSHGE